MDYLPSGQMLFNVAKYAAGASAAGSVLLAGGLWWFQRSMIYPSNVPGDARTYVPRPSVVALPYQDLHLTTSDNVKLHAYLIPARRQFVSTAELQNLSTKERKERAEREIKEWEEASGSEDAVQYVKSRPTVIIFHANAGNMGHRVPIARKFNVDCRCNVFMLSYRGYGLSEGIATEEGIKRDIEATMEYLSTHEWLGGTKFVVYGQSLGGAVSLWAASRHPDMVSGVIIENTFLSLAALVPAILPKLPTFLLPLLLTEKWDASRSLPLIPAATPVLMLSGRKDALIPPSHMDGLRQMREDGVGTEKKGRGKVRWKTFADGEHNDTFLCAGYWDEVKQFMEEEIEGLSEKRGVKGAEGFSGEEKAVLPEGNGNARL